MALKDDQLAEAAERNRTQQAFIEEMKVASKDDTLRLLTDARVRPPSTLHSRSDTDHKGPNSKP
jgi:hypothetical protein